MKPPSTRRGRTFYRKFSIRKISVVCRSTWAYNSVLPSGGISRPMGSNLIERDQAVEAGVAGFVDHAHATFAGLLQNLVMRDGAADHGIESVYRRRCRGTLLAICGRGLAADERRFTRMENRTSDRR